MNGMHTLEPQDIQTNSMFKVAFASFIGTAVEFYDFYIYGLASALVLGTLFFPSDNPGLEVMASFLTFGIAFLARPIGAVLFGHYGDKLGRKATLIASLLIMGISTTLIGFLPTYQSAGLLGPILLCLLRFGQGLGLGGEWGGAALLATENAPKGRRALYAVFPQVGPPAGFIAASGIFILLNACLSKQQMLEWGWRVPFVFSIALVILGVYVRTAIVESPAFQRLTLHKAQAKVPFFEVIKHHPKQIVLGTLSAMSCFTLFFLSTVFILQYETAKHPWLKQPFFAKMDFLFVLMVAIVFMALSSPIAAYLSERIGRKFTLLLSGAASAVLGLMWGEFTSTGNLLSTGIFISVCLFVMGILYTPLGAFLPEIFPTKVRYTGASITFSFAGILGGSLTPFFAAALINKYGELGSYYVGYFLFASCLISVIAVCLLHETKSVDL